MLWVVASKPHRQTSPEHVSLSFGLRGNLNTLLGIKRLCPFRAAQPAGSEGVAKRPNRTSGGMIDASQQASKLPLSCHKHTLSHHRSLSPSLDSSNQSLQIPSLNPLLPVSTTTLPPPLSNLTHNPRRLARHDAPRRDDHRWRHDGARQKLAMLSDDAEI